MNEEDVQKQLKQMMAFIEQEANEKAEEIDAKAEEEFNIEKGKLVQQQRTKIMEYYEKKEKQVELQKKIQGSNMLNQARLKVLKEREAHIDRVLSETKARLANIARDPNGYKNIMSGLISQAAYQLSEPELLLKCKQSDIGLVEQVLPSCMNKVQQDLGASMKVVVDKNNCLSADSAGGIIMSTRDGKIMVNSTLEARLDLISQKMVPEIRGALFGKNPNRKFQD